ncbi:hypothetical protein ACHAW6_003359 [Cyclotella cf. meneghiniana]
MESVLASINDADVYIDDVGDFLHTWVDHVKLLGNILCHLHENGFTINPLKCDWAMKETEWVDYWLTPQGLKPWKKKIDAILHMKLVPSHAHILKPLTDHSGFKKLVPTHCALDMETVFDKMCMLMVADALAAYPDHNK